MIVMKFGGAVLRSSSGFHAMLEILKKEKSNEIVVIISAFSLSTRNLIEAARIAETGKIEESLLILDSVINEHYEFAREILIGSNPRIYKLYLDSSNQLQKLLRGISLTKELSPRTLDYIMSFGELLALHTVDCFLKESDLNFEVIDSTDIIITDSNYGKAKPDLDLTREKFDEKIKSSLKKNRIIIMQGFVARSTQNEITTMGLESSNMTAGLAALFLEASELYLFSDVTGIRTADPKYVFNTELISGISPSDAHTLALAGMKLVYPDMIDLLKNTKTKLIYKSAFSPDEAGTVVSEVLNLSKTLIILKENIVLGKYDSEAITQNIFSQISVINIRENLMDNMFPELGKIFCELNPVYIEFDKMNKKLIIIIYIENTIAAIQQLHKFFINS